jgi:hypothetical protein
MTLVAWRNVLHKFIVITGSLALITIVTGTNFKDDTGSIILTEEFFQKKSSSPSPLLVSQCKDKNQSSYWSTILLHTQNQDFCANKEVSYDYGQGSTYLQR